MAKTAQQVFSIIQNKLANTLRALPAIIGEEAVNFSLENFDMEAWNGASIKNWVKRKNTSWNRKNDDQGRALLVKTGKLKRSIRITKMLNDRVWVGAGGPDVPYAKAHNFGFEGMVKQEVKPFTRRTKKGKAQVKGHTRTVYQNIPQRQFIGGEKDAPKLKQRIKNACKEEFIKIFK